MKKPRDVPVRDDKYMGLAFMHAAFSKDPSTHVGAVIVNQQNEILGTGYNGPPKRINDNQINWDRPFKYSYIVHAEANAIEHATLKPIGCTLYVTGMPCSACMLRIVDAEIFRVVYYDFKKVADGSSMLQNLEDVKITEDIAVKGGVQLAKYVGNLNWMRDRIKLMESYGLFN